MSSSPSQKHQAPHTDALADFEVLVPTNWGELVFVCGSVPTLGEWDPIKAIPLVCQERKENGYVWRTPTSVSVPKQLVVEYKYFKTHTHGIQWEVSPNRSFKIQSAEQVVVVDALFDHPGEDFLKLIKCKWPEMPADPQEAALFEVIRAFALDPKRRQMTTGVTTRQERRSLHRIAGLFRLEHRTVETGNGEQAIQLDKTETFGLQSRSTAARSASVHSPHAAKVPPVDPKWTPEQLGFYNDLVTFVSSGEQSMSFPVTLDSAARRFVHSLAEQFEILEHESIGKHDNRCIKITKADKVTLQQKREQLALLDEAMTAYLGRLSEAEKQSLANPVAAVGPVVAPAEQLARKGLLRYVNWNIEWMDHFFDSDTAFKVGDHEVPDYAAVCNQVASVLQQLDADIVAIQEGPANIARMQFFVKTFLKDGYEVFGGLESNTQQIYYLVKKGGYVLNAHLYKEADEFLQQPWTFDVQGDCTLKSYKFTRRPVVLAGDVFVNGKPKPFFACAMHTKSKFVALGEKMWKSVKMEEKQKFIRASVKNRRRIAAECTRLRKCINEFMFAKFEDPLVITSGDYNDGPGLDFFEEFYLLFDSIDALLGTPFSKTKTLESLLIRSRFVAKNEQWSCEFDDYVDNIKSRRVLLDHIFVCLSLFNVTKQAKVAHSLFESSIRPEVRGTPEERMRKNRPSDHRPVFADFL